MQLFIYPSTYIFIYPSTYIYATKIRELTYCFTNWAQCGNLTAKAFCLDMALFMSLIYSITKTMRCKIKCSTVVFFQPSLMKWVDYSRKMKTTYLKTARVRDQSTNGFRSSNFARLFIRCRPPKIKAAYRAENRNDFFLWANERPKSYEIKM